MTRRGEIPTRKTRARRLRTTSGAWVVALLLASTAFMAIGAGSAGATKSNYPPVAIMANLGGPGYYIVASDGGVFSFGDAPFYGSMGGKTLVAPVVGAAERHGGAGYWLVGADGGVFSFGSAKFFGSMAGKTLSAPVVGIAATPTNNGYWLTAKDGGIFSFGDAKYYGGMAGKTLAKPIVGMAATSTGLGYWLVGADGGIFSFGDAKYYGGLGGTVLAKPVVGMAATSTGKGYWLVAADGGIFSYGDAAFRGSMGGKTLNGAVVGMAMTSTGSGYWLTAKDGGVFSFGDAAFYGTLQVLATPGAPTGLSALRAAIVASARSQVGITEDPFGSNQVAGNRYGNGGQSWCAFFATWVWRQAGVNIPSNGFSGYFYSWGTAAGSPGHVRAAGATPKPGDAVLYGTGPQNTGTSTHVNIIIVVHSATVWDTIGGNESNAVSYSTSHWASHYYAIVSPDQT